MNPTIIGIIIILVLLLVLAGIIYSAYRTITNKIRRFSQMAFGTNSIAQGLSKVETEYATTPKSVSAGTGLYLPKITKDFPDYNYEEMRNRARNVLLSFLRSIDADNAALLTEGTDELKNKLDLLLQGLRSKGERAHFDNLKIHRTEICRYQKQKGRCSIIFQSAIEYFYYKEVSGKITEGSKNTKKQSRFNVECIYIQDRDIVDNLQDMALGVICPNCLAPISGLGAKVCAYCGSPVVEFNIHAWYFSDVKEV